MINNNSEIVSFHNHSTPEFIQGNLQGLPNIVSKNLYPIEYYSRIKPGMKPSIMIKPSTTINSILPNVIDDQNLTFQNIQNQHIPNIIKGVENTLGSMDKQNMVNIINLLGSLAISSMSNNQINQNFALKLKNLVEDTSSNFVNTNLLEKSSSQKQISLNATNPINNNNIGMQPMFNLNLKNFIIPKDIPFNPLRPMPPPITVHPVHLNKLEVKYVGDAKDILNPKPKLIDMEEIYRVASDISKATDQQIKDGKLFVILSNEFFKD